MAISMIFSGCAQIGGSNDPLDPSKPITVTLWHYYSGNIKDQFDAMVADFNETQGMERGVVVDAQSLGDVQQLADAVFNAANKTIGSQPLPDMFMAYPDNAFRVNQVSELVSLEELFTQEELKRYRAEFLEEGRFGDDKKLRILPIAKSTENLYINKTFWDSFVQETGADVAQLSTWEGVVAMAERYYEHTGKAFLAIDANANYMLLSAMQLGSEIYAYGEDGVQLNLSKESAEKIWENYYIPYIKGYFEKNGRFSSDDAKTGNVIAYTGSTAGAAYFPMEVTLQQDEIYAIEPMTLPFPYFGSGKPYAIQQGAGMCITKSDEAHQFASALFLKWFTDPAQNVEFAVSTGYFPVMTEALEKDILLEEIKKSEAVGGAINQMIESTLQMFDSHTLYNNKPFEGSYEMRALLENHLSGKVTTDLESLNQRMAEGEDRTQVIEALISQEEFERWYEAFQADTALILGE